MIKAIIKSVTTGLVSLLLLAACAPASPGTTSGSTTAAGTIASTTAATTTAATTITGELELTLEELAKYDGTNGQPAYIAVDGIIYDVTNSKPWKDGKHNGFTAGKDLTNEIKTISPHGVVKLELVPKVGKIKK